MCWKKAVSNIFRKFGWYKSMVYIDASIIKMSIEQHIFYVKNRL